MSWLEHHADTQSYRFNFQSGHITKTTKECINRGTKNKINVSPSLRSLNKTFLKSDGSKGVEPRGVFCFVSKPVKVL